MQPVINLNKLSLTFLNVLKEEIKGSHKSPHSTIFFLGFCVLVQTSVIHTQVNVACL